jgi:hypothetical protein
MISPKIAMLTAFMAVSSMGAIPALAQDIDTNAVVNSIEQDIDQSNEACTNTLVAIADAESGDASSFFGDAESEADAEVEVDSEQSNKCKVDQSNEAEQEAEIESDNFQAIVDIFT